MISECGSEIERLAKELDESREMSSLLEGNLKVIQDAHFVEEARFDSRIGELKRDLGKTVICLLKAKEAKASKSSELRRLKRKVKSGEGSSVCVIREAKEPMRAEFQTRLARIADSLDSLAAIHVKDLALAGVEGVIYHGFYPLLAMIYRCFNIYLLLYRVYLECLQVQVCSGEIW